MHELGIARDLWDLVRRSCESSGISRLSRIEIVVGEASGIQEEFLRHSLVDHLFPGTIAEGADLVLTVEPYAARCGGCGHTLAGEEMCLCICPGCGSQDLSIVSGKDTYVKNIEGHESL